jgi:hypothetical protein
MNGNDDVRPSDDFDEYARSAGASLRRPAPAGGLQQVRAIRRRRRITQAVGAGTAVALLAVAGAVLVLRDRDDSNITTTPDTTESVTPDRTEPTTEPNEVTTTTPPTTEPNEVTTTTPPTTVDRSGDAPTAQAPFSDQARTWIDARAADGLTQAQITQGEGTTALLIATWNPIANEFASAVMLPDGRVVNTPTEYTAYPYAFRLYSVGERPVLVDISDGGLPVLWLLDPATGEWSSGPDLGLGDVAGGAPAIEPFRTYVVDGSLLVVVDSYVRGSDDVLSPAPDRRGVVLHPDLTVTPIAAPPDGVPMSWSSVSGSKALQLFTPNGGADTIAPVPGQWAYDVTTDAWTPVAAPEWFPCSTLPQCTWIGPFEMGDANLEVIADRGVVVRIPDGSVGLYDAGADAWTRLDDAPFPLSLPRTLTIGEQVLVAPMRSFDNDYGLVGVVDLRTGSWTTFKIEFPADRQAEIDAWFDASWEIRTDGLSVMLAPSIAQRGTNRDPLAVYDPATASWSSPTAADIATWRRYPSIFGTEGI